MVGFWVRGAQGAIKGFKALKKLRETTEETKRYLLNLPPKKK